MGIWISPRVRQKLLSKHNVSEDEIVQCFQNMEATSKFLTDPREEHQSNLTTYWFISETNRRRKLKVVFVIRYESGKVITEIKTAFPPCLEEMEIYERKGL